MPRIDLSQSSLNNALNQFRATKSLLSAGFVSPLSFPNTNEFHTISTGFDVSAYRDLTFENAWKNPFGQDDVISALKLYSEAPLSWNKVCVPESVYIGDYSIQPHIFDQINPMGDFNFLFGEFDEYLTWSRYQNSCIEVEYCETVASTHKFKQKSGALFALIAKHLSNSKRLFKYQYKLKEKLHKLMTALLELLQFPRKTAKISFQFLANTTGQILFVWRYWAKVFQGASSVEKKGKGGYQTA